MKDTVLRICLTELLRGGSAHLTLDKALKNLPEKARTLRPWEGGHSVWEILEHMRLAQEDILRYCLDASWTSPPFPEGYWPGNPEVLDDADWHSSIRRFKSDLKEVIRLVQDPGMDLTEEIPHGHNDHTYLREVLLVADHNAYHLGQIMDIRKALAVYGKA